MMKLYEDQTELTSNWFLPENLMGDAVLHQRVPDESRRTLLVFHHLKTVNAANAKATTPTERRSLRYKLKLHIMNQTDAEKENHGGE